MKGTIIIFSYSKKMQRSQDPYSLDTKIVSCTMNKMEKIFLLLGSNIGSLKANLNKALEKLEKNNIKIVKKSEFHTTKPWGHKKQPEFLNMAVEVICPYEPLELLDVLKQIEHDMGRKKTGVRWGPRIIDIDIIFFGDRIVETANLTIPHKEIYNRPFALQLLMDIAPDFMPPCRKNRLIDIYRGLEYAGSAVCSN